MRYKLFLLLVGAALLLGPATALTQYGPPGGGRPGGGRPMMNQGGPGGSSGRWGGGNRMSMDPNERWNQMTGGKDVWVRAEISDPNQVRMFDWIARSNNIVNGQITRQQYLDAMQQFQQRMRGGMGRQGGSPGGGPRGGGPGGGMNPDAMAEAFFRNRDANGDGLLNYDEMPDNLKAEKDRWDTNKDGHIDLNEFKEFFKARMQQIQSERGAAGGIPGFPGGGGGGAPQGAVPSLPQGIETDKKPVVFRGANIPKEIPQEYRQMDTDKDGQIGLYEWKAAGRSVDDFLAIDRNADGFITVEELLRYLGGSRTPTTGNAVAGGPGAVGAPGMGGAAPWGGNGPGGRPGWGANIPGGGRPSWGGGSPGGGRPSWGGGSPGGGRPSWGGNGPGGRSRGGSSGSDGSGRGRGGRSRGGFGG